MLKLTFADQTGRLTDGKLRAEAEKYAPLLAGMKEKAGLDPMSTGWMELEKWAGGGHFVPSGIDCRGNPAKGGRLCGDRSGRLQQRRPVDGRGAEKAGKPRNHLGGQHPFRPGDEPDAPFS